MQGSKSNFFAKSNKRNRYFDDDYSSNGNNTKRKVDGNKVARQKANRQPKNDYQDYGY